MNKDAFLCRLNAIVREVTCMSDTKFKERFKNYRMRFDYFCVGESAKIHTDIYMEKIEIIKEATEF